MVSINKHLLNDWPELKGKSWPKDLGPQPTQDAVKVALSVARSNTAVGMALAMYARTCGSTDSLAATAASLATGSTSATHRVKRDQLTVAGMLAKDTVGHESGHQVVRISLPTKTKTKTKTKTVKRTPKTKTVEKTA